MATKPYVNEVVEEILKPVYFKKHQTMVDFNLDVIYRVCDYLGIPTEHIKRSSDLDYSVSNNRLNKYNDYLDAEGCSILMVDEGKGELLSTNEDLSSLMEQDENFAKLQGEQDFLFYVPVKKILPKHYNIIEILCEYGKGTIDLLKH
jgi:hypothetical protein